MKNGIKIALILMLALGLGTPTLTAQDSGGPELKEDKIWSVEYIRTKPGKSEAYNKYLAKNYVKLMDRAKAQGVIADYILLSAMPATEDDWDIMILIAVNKFSDLDNINESFDKLVAEVFDPKDEGRQKELMSRYEMRDFMGGKMARNLVLK